MLFKQPCFLLFVGFPKSRLFDTVQYLPKLFFFFIGAFLIIVDFIDRSFWFDGPISELSFQSATSLMKGSSCFLSLIERELVASCRTRFFPQISNYLCNCIQENFTFFNSFRFIWPFYFFKNTTVEANSKPKYYKQWGSLCTPFFKRDCYVSTRFAFLMKKDFCRKSVGALSMGDSVKIQEWKYKWDRER